MKNLRTLLLMLVLYAPFAIQAAPPNIVFIMCDDMGYGQLGCYGQKMIRTPHLDQMAAEGLRLTDYYSGTSVCAPSRCSLMTGLHVGHTPIRGNLEYSNGQEPIPASTVTVAEKLKEAGYVTALIGKWGLGYPGSEGDPNRQGFDLFFGYNDQKRAHSYYPGWVWKNDEKVELGAKDTSEGYSHYALTREARRFIQDYQNKPFFLYLAYTIPHAHLEIPADDPCFLQYQNEDWPEKQKIHAGMISRMDEDVGGILKLLQDTGLAEQTLVVFTSDNGPHKEGGAIPGFFQDSGPLRGIKRDMYEGGVRVPFIAWWPGTVAPAQVSDHLAAHWDLMPTACDLAGVAAPENTDGISYLPLLKGNPADQKQHDSVYFELFWPTRRGLRQGDWTLIQQNTTALSTDEGDPLELYNLKNDLAQANNVISRYPEKAEQLKARMMNAHSEDEIFYFGAVKESAKKAAGKKPAQQKPAGAFSIADVPSGWTCISQGGTVTHSTLSARFGIPHNHTLLTTMRGKQSFHTDAEKEPWVIIDLQKEEPVIGLEILNRDDAQGRRTRNLHVWVSNDRKNWIEVFQTLEPQKKWIFQLKEQKTARYVKIGLINNYPQFFHLKGVKVYTPTGAAAPADKGAANPDKRVVY